MSIRALGCIIATVLFAVDPALAQQPAPTPTPTAPRPTSPEEEHKRPRVRAAEIRRAREYFTDGVLVNQDGQEMRFYSDLLHGKTVVIIPFFTTCTGVCPVLSRKMAAIQRRLSDRLGNQLHLVSISVDPETDTPMRLKAYAERFRAKPGWYFLGGTKENVDWVLYKLGQYVDNKEAHTNIFIIGNETTGEWRKFVCLGTTEELIRVVEEVLDAKS